MFVMREINSFEGEGLMLSFGENVHTCFLDQPPLIRRVPLGSKNKRGEKEEKGDLEKKIRENLKQPRN